MNKLPIDRAPCSYLGFTLVEVMLAIGITALVGLLAYQGIRVAIVASEQQAYYAEQLADLQLAFTVLERDIQHIVDRPIMDAYGMLQPALFGGALYEYPLVLSRRGWDNPLGLRRSGLQRVRYRLDGEQLWREYWLAMDRLSEEEDLQRVVLLDGVETFSARFLQPVLANTDGDAAGEQWVDNWGPDSNNSSTLPLAISITLTLREGGEMQRIFEVL